jgi:GrpB-like predicted nucleotidyltransferase (UPF0157 family)
MDLSKEHVKIIDPSEELFKIVDKYIEMIHKILPESKITLVGSLAVPMCGKEEFDLLVEVKNIKQSQLLIESKSKGRFGIGPIVDDVGYCRSKKKFGIICEIHLLKKGHPKIKQCLGLVKKLKLNSKILNQYENLKRSLDGSTEEKYKKEKNKFLNENNLV